MEMPTHLIPVVDAAVAHAYGEGPAPEGLAELQEWIESEDYDALVADAVEWLALDLPRLADVEFNDFTARDRLDLKPRTKLTDAMRLEAARLAIATAFEEADAYCDSIFSYRLTDSAGRVAVMGVTATSQGQLGPAFAWLGVFYDEEGVRKAFAAAGLVPEGDSDISDDAILGLWKLSDRS